MTKEIGAVKYHSAFGAILRTSQRMVALANSQNSGQMAAMKT